MMTTKAPEPFTMEVIAGFNLELTEAVVAGVKNQRKVIRPTSRPVYLETEPVDNGTAARLFFNDEKGERLIVDMDVEMVDALIAALAPMFEQRSVNWATTWQRVKNPHHILER